VTEQGKRAKKKEIMYILYSSELLGPDVNPRMKIRFPYVFPDHHICNNTSSFADAGYSADGKKSFILSCVLDLPRATFLGYILDMELMSLQRTFGRISLTRLKL
jgi:hypothetical protein